MMNKKIYLIEPDNCWSTELYHGCLELEDIVNNMDGITIQTFHSDYQPSYDIYKQVGSRVYSLIVSPRIKNGITIYLVQDQLTRIMNLLDEMTNVRRQICRELVKPGGALNPHVWSKETLINNIVNIDMNKGFEFKKAS